MTPHGSRKPTVRAAQAVGTVLAGVMLSSCGQAAGGEDLARPPVPENTPAPSGAETQQGQVSPVERAPDGEAAPAGSGDANPGGQTVSESSQANVPPPGVANDRCHTSMLSGEVRPGSPGAGQRYADLVLTNTSGQTCDLYGYGGLQLVDTAGAPLPTDLSRVANPGPMMITLSPGESASKTLHWTAFPSAGEPADRPCQPEPNGARVIPPDETDPLSVDWSLGPVCGFGSIEGSAYHQ